MNMNSIEGLRIRKANTTNPTDIANIDARIAEIEARMAAPDLSHLTEATRAEVIEWEGQLEFCLLDGGRERAIRARIAELMVAA